MKKLLALLLIAVICLPLAACGENNPNYNTAAKNYMGKWMLFGQDGYYVEILDNGVAKSISPDETNELRWSYNSDMEGILLAGNGASPYFIQISEEAGCKYILMDGNALYHEDDMENASVAEGKRSKKIIDNRFADFTKANLGDSILMADGVTIQLTKVVREKDSMILHVSMTNSREKTITLAAFDFYMGFVYNRTSYSTRHTSLSTKSAMIEPGQTIELTLSTDCAQEGVDIQYMLIGFNLTNGKYCFDVSEFMG